MDHQINGFVHQSVPQLGVGHIAAHPARMGRAGLAGRQIGEQHITGAAGGRQMLGHQGLSQKPRGTGDQHTPWRPHGAGVLGLHGRQ